MADAVDLRSDTVTKPSRAMREAMARAEVGDDVFAEDPTVLELERRAAQVVGHEAALFMPSGCMANLVAELSHARRGDEIICGTDVHIAAHEVGSGAAVAGVQLCVVPGDGRISAEQVAERIKTPTFHEPGTALVWVENTHNMAGGRITPVAEMRHIALVARAAGVPVHLDGARLFNAAVALGVPAREIARHADSVSFCLSKGLGAPAGSMLCGGAAFRERALRFRKMLGGGMRQVGILAAAGIFALERNVERLAEDHARARRLAEGLAGTKGLDVRPEDVETNMVMADVEGQSADDLARRAEARGVRFLAMSRRRVRFVTHLDVDDAGIETAIRVIREEAAC